MNVLVSVAAADYACLGEAVRRAEQAGADAIHLDLEDGVFSPDLTFGVRMVQHLRRWSTLPFDVHLMVHRPAAYVAGLHAAGASAVTVHFEACPYPLEVVRAIRELGMRAGVAVNPRTPVNGLDYLADAVDQWLIMTAEHDGRGQQFLPDMTDKVAAAAALATPHGAGVIADGGVTPAWAGVLRRHGATGVVAGRAFFASPDPVRAVAELRRAGSGD